MGKWLKKWQDVLFWLPLTALVAIAAYQVIPLIDPRAGIDGWGDLFATLVAGIKGVLATIAAWRCKAKYWFEPGPADEAAWRARNAYGVQILDRLEFAAWLAFWSWVLF
ncbi:MAG TPA: hypothetical protein VFE72_02845 [Lysobacter sp.]|nr:hypothetical protein [Lysobacter sp.]